MSAMGAAFDAFKALFTADTGVGGLNEPLGDGAAKVHRFVRSRDGASQDAANPPTPHIRFEGVMAERDATEVKHASGVVRLFMIADRDQDGAKFDTIDARMRALYHEATSLAAAGWDFSIPTLIRSTWLSAPGNQARLLQEYRVKATQL